MRLIPFIAILMALSGCASNYLDLADGLNKRQVKGCTEYEGSGSLGATGIGGGTGMIHVVITTGGIELNECVEALR